ncbi:taste receptor type 2 member 5 [Orycteropus afer afer]|uniref:Taste receptor type 2 n=1 Tax=Orycteropus afer afer TaxID=1230840 RepID=A0A8B7ATL9_ORYAF|nr:taste receptor type 2 member 5 [Orycteropus afer afer]
MVTVAQGLLMVVAMAEFLIGVVGNGVLMVWSIGEWTKRARQSTYSRIILGLASCRFLLQWLIMTELNLFLLFQSSRWLCYLSVTWVLVSQASLWFTTFLSIFYCLKITTFKHPAYVWLKKQAYGLSFWALVGYLIITLLLLTHMAQQPYMPSQGNSSIPHPFLSWHYFHIFLFNSGSWLPFSLFLLYSGMLMVSLYRHHRMMKVFTMGRRDVQAQAHVTALRSLGCFLVLHIVYVLASPISITAKWSTLDLTSVFFSETLMAASPSLHSALLVLGNPRVRQPWQRILQKLVHACRGGGP